MGGFEMEAESVHFFFLVNHVSMGIMFGESFLFWMSYTPSNRGKLPEGLCKWKEVGVGGSFHVGGGERWKPWVLPLPISPEANPPGGRKGET